MRWLCQAVHDFGREAYEVFRRSPDHQRDIAEDITREALDLLPGYRLAQRIFGTVDYKQARYVVLPDHVIRQALFVDSKAEKTASSATLQMSQLSLEVRQRRQERELSVQGTLPQFLRARGHCYLSTTAILHFMYDDVDEDRLPSSEELFQEHLEPGQGHFWLRRVTIALVPNGLLQERYNPSADEGIWNVGRNAPTLGEDFRVRLSFKKLETKCTWRVQRIEYAEGTGEPTFQWSE